VITRGSEGVAKEDILAGVHEALANKSSALVSTVGLEEPCAIGGAIALDIGLIKSIEEKLKLRLLVPPQPQIITALGGSNRRR
jgi:(R)-2-hydroxyacyl-CoA dehydratese activating ATPase